MQRVFNAKIKGQTVPLPDPNPILSPEAVLNFYSGTYPELTTAKVGDPTIKDDRYVYEFNSVMGNKG